MASPLGGTHNPDVLTCLANLSNDEVFTPPELADRVLDLLPEELWHDPTVRILDPFCKSGVFLREAAKRFIRGLEPVFPDLQERVDHIMHEQLFGIAITELTALLSRRSLYCSKFPNGRFSVSAFGGDEGNVRFRNISHTWREGRCAYCGASRSGYDRDESLETHAYEFIHTTHPEEIFGMKFDVIVGNPPYQLNVGVEKENYAVAIYDKFVSQAKRLNPRYLTMIIPSRWFAGGRGLDAFRAEMLHDDRLRVLHDFPNASDCFPGVQIKAGVCYFLWDRDHPGPCEVTTHLDGVSPEPMTRPLLEPGMDTFVRYNQAISILRKVRATSFTPMSTMVSPQTPFGIVTSYKGHPTRELPTDIKMYISGNDAAHKGKAFYAPAEMVTKGHEMIPWHKLYINMAGSGSDSFPHQILSKPFYGEPGTICNQSYLVIGPFADREEAENARSYIATKFFRFMVLQKKNAQHAMRGVYEFVPVQDFSHPWTDEMLYERYGLDDGEVAFIESMIKPMNLGEPDEG